MNRLASLPFVRSGKVRDIYAADEQRLLIVQSDRISAFDVILNETVPDKGKILTEMSFFWFAKFSHIANHLTGEAPESVLSDPADVAAVAGRAMLVRKLQPLPIEAVCRGYIIGSGWKEYLAGGEVCGMKLPAGLRLAEKLPETLFTPATKAPEGEHDENISYAKMADIVGAETAAKVRDASLALYNGAAEYAARRGVIIADTKFEFALDDGGELVLIDEVLTPDSSRFWPADEWRAGENPTSFDKQHVRDWLETVVWDKKPPPPAVPAEVISATARRYKEISERLTK